MIAFNKPFMVDNEFKYIKDAIDSGKICGDGKYTKKCNEFLEYKLGVKKALLTHSCTAALEMAAILADIKDGDEIIMPSYTFVSTANAFVLRGGIPVFVDIDENTLCINEKLIEQAITPKTKAICVVHYAGISCDMDMVMKIAKEHDLMVIEDAAQALGSFYKDKPLGSIGDIACFSFHETKNIISGEGGAIIINNPKLIERAEIIREKGTNRNKFFRGEVDKYTWVDIGSSYLPSEIVAAFLYSQLENMDKINLKRIDIWNRYNEDFIKIDYIKTPYVPSYARHNAHMYYLLFHSVDDRSRFIEFLKQNGVYSVFHYIPLHSSLAGKTFGRFVGDMRITDKVSDTLVRLPMFYELSDSDIDKIVEIVNLFKRDIYCEKLLK